MCFVKIEIDENIRQSFEDITPPYLFESTPEEDFADIMAVVPEKTTEVLQENEAE